MSKNILITGGSGFIGSHLIADWLTENHSIHVLTRNPDRLLNQWQRKVNAYSEFDAIVESMDWVVNLAGEGIADQRWTKARKQVLRDSRIGVTERLVRWAQQTNQHFEVVLSGSAIGIYGGSDGSPESQTVSESSPEGDDFAATLCRDWEYAALPLDNMSQRLILLRTGLVWGEHQGMLKRLWFPFRMGLGGVIGSGNQYLSWIHIQDYCRAVNQLLGDSDVTGPINMTAPSPVTNRAFTEELADTLSRPALMPMPGCAARLAFGEMSDLLTKGQRVLPQRLQEMGFHYDYPDAHKALAAIRAAW